MDVHDDRRQLCSIMFVKIQFLGARVVFLDLRHAFLFGLYCGNVEGARLDGVLTHIDTVRY